MPLGCLTSAFAASKIPRMLTLSHVLDGHYIVAPFSQAGVRGGRLTYNLEAVKPALEVDLCLFPDADNLDAHPKRHQLLVALLRLACQKRLGQSRHQALPETSIAGRQLPTGGPYAKEN